ncbi:MAG TPA: alpha/beta fold hydrolase [Nocardioidaceae bacterium]|nr:alpha/beta fold hydrolase [Nocardioidaceae bacterium]
MQIDPRDEPFLSSATPQADGQRVGVLLSQGFTGTPASMRAWAEHLAAHGYAVSAPLLPGHATRWQDLNKKRWADWYGEVQLAFDKLHAECDQVVVGGLSMGGGLVLQLAADRGREVAGVMVVNPAVNIARWDVKLLPVLKHVVPAMPGIGSDIKKPGVEERAYRHTPLKAAHSMLQGYAAVRKALPDITQPLLLMTSTVDRVVDPSSAQIIRSTVSSRDVTELRLENSYHVATVDNDAPAIFDASLEFVRRVTGP